MHMNHKLAPAFAALALTVLPGCASIVEGGSQSVLINTPGVQDASCTLTSPEIGTQVVSTPGSVTLSKSKHDVQIKCVKEGYQETAAKLASEFQGWTIGNILFGGIIGVGIDAASGAMNKYQPQIDVAMYKIGEKPPPAPQAAPQPTATPGEVPYEQRPKCSDVGGYEAYLNKTNKMCRLD